MSAIKRWKNKLSRVANPLDTERHRLALKAALLDGEAGARAFAAWRLLVPLDAVNELEFGLLPSIYRRAAERGDSDSSMDRLKGVYRQVWVRNTLALQTCARVIELLETAGVRTLLLGDIAISVRWTASAAPRVVHGLEVLIYRADAHQAAQIVVQNGWRADGHRASRPTEAELGRLTGVAFCQDDACDLTLRWRVPSGDMPPGENALLWSASERADVAGVATRVLCAEDQLYLTLLHGAQSGRNALDWVFDANAIIRSRPGLDWDRLLDHARRDASGASIARQFRVLDGLLGLKFPIEAALDAQRRLWPRLIRRHSP